MKYVFKIETDVDRFMLPGIKAVSGDLANSFVVFNKMIFQFHLLLRS